MSRPIPVCLLTFLLASFCGTSLAKTVYVSTDGNDDSDGLSWVAAKATVQAGLNTAESADQVWVAKGTYVQCITLKSGVGLYGGFNGTETELSQRHWSSNVTTLDGNHAGVVVTAPVNASAATRIDGFTISHGMSAGYGGGIRCEDASALTIANNTICNNDDGGIYCDVDCHAVIVSNTITGNRRNQGGGITCVVSFPEIIGNRITDNTADEGGGIYCVNLGGSRIITIVGNVICRNSLNPYGSGHGGGIYCASPSAKICNNTVVSNHAPSGLGGGVYCDFLANMSTLANNVVAFNSSGIYAELGIRPVFTNNCVYGNAAYDYYGTDDPTGTNSNISLDPNLVDPANSDFHIQPTSPCVDAGDDAVLQSDWLDIDGQTRIQGSHVDIGADESDGTVWPGPPAVIHVSENGSDDNNGLTWAAAKRTLQEGINASGAGTQVWVAAGTYVENVVLITGVALYGGFAGTETDISQRDWDANVTILDGNRSGSVVWAPPNAIQTTRIDGFTIRNGTGTSDALAIMPACGGAVCCDASSSPTIANDTIINNNAYYGGGIYCGECSSATIMSSTFISNKSCLGGGIYCEYPIWQTVATATISNNRIVTNSAYCGGGIYSRSTFTVVANNVISDNTAFNTGGGMDIRNSTIINNSITGNDASCGGGIYSNGQSSSLTYNMIAGNSAYYGAGVYCSLSPTICSNTICGNTACKGGGGLFCDSGSRPTVTGNTITANDADEDGGGIYSDEGSLPYVSDTIIAFNSSGFYYGGGTLSVGYCCLFGNTAYDYVGLTEPTGTDGNVLADPRFVQAPNSGPDNTWGTSDDDPGDLHLQYGSPCINAGDPAFASAPEQTDKDGLPRVLSGRIDIGSYEFRLVGDVNGDNYVNVADLQGILVAWGSSDQDNYWNWNPACDLNTDNCINVADLQILATNWGRSL